MFVLIQLKNLNKEAALTKTKLVTNSNMSSETTTTTPHVQDMHANADAIGPIAMDGRLAHERAIFLSWSL